MWISERTAIISLYSINLSVFKTEAESVYCAVRTGSLNQTDTVSYLELIVLETSAYRTHWIEGHRLSSELPEGERNRDESGSEVGQPLPRLSLVGSSA